MKFVSIFKLDPSTFSAGPPDEKTIVAMDRLVKEMMESGVLVDTGGVLPAGASMRVQRSGERLTVTDGPFTESKEIVGGFAVLQVHSKDEALACTRRFLEVVGSGTCELHEVSEKPNPDL